MSKEKLLRELEESVEIEVPDIGVPHQSAEPQVVEVEVEEDVENFCWQKWRRQGTLQVEDYILKIRSKLKSEIFRLSYELCMSSIYTIL